ncbi:VOC family protein [Cellulomonas palmilytica]|uniref:VOC family protein n=1 Tax=Cellulomonas palmilytica TaxID=2608402 RepID=UPI001F3402D6|nr:VOC family protein [Cellulomonas palmilytica]UJP41313.1 VOC family protein [Cellulomonas palmilytica]
MGATVPYITVHDARAALDFYAAAFGATVGERYDDEDGRVGHAELDIHGAPVYVSDEYPDYGAYAPRTLGGRSSAAVVVSVPDVDATYADALRAGATQDRPPADMPGGGRGGWLVDPYGHRWLVRSS